MLPRQFGSTQGITDSTFTVPRLIGQLATWLARSVMNAGSKTCRSDFGRESRAFVSGSMRRLTSRQKWGHRREPHQPS